MKSEEFGQLIKKYGVCYWADHCLLKGQKCLSCHHSSQLKISAEALATLVTEPITVTPVTGGLTENQPNLCAKNKNSIKNFAGPKNKQNGGAPEIESPTMAHSSSKLQRDVPDNTKELKK